MSILSHMVVIQELEGSVCLVSQAKILDARICQVTEGQVMEEQAGFRVGRGCRDQVLAVRQLGEKTIEKDGKMYAAFIDLEKA